VRCGAAARDGRDPDKARREAVAALEPPAMALCVEIRRQKVAVKAKRSVDIQ
jgi:hypothetical protein